MRLGITFDLAATWAAEGLAPEDLAEFDAPETIAAIEDFLTARGHEAVRIGRARELVGRLAQGERWDLVFNICEGRGGSGREALAPALLDAYGVPYTFAGPLVLALALDKALTKRVWRDAGLPTAPFAVLADATDAARVELAYPLFAKPVAEGTGKGIGATSLCRNPDELTATGARLLARFEQSVLVEPWLPGREFTVGVLGAGASARVLGVMEVVAPAPYGFDIKKHYEGRVSYRLVDDPEAREAARAALAAWRVLGGRDGGRVDLKSDAAGRPMLLEANPLAGLHPVDSDLVIIARLAGHSYEWLLEEICAAAAARAELPWGTRPGRNGAAAPAPGSVAEAAVPALERADRA